MCVLSLTGRVWDSQLNFGICEVVVSALSA